MSDVSLYNSICFSVRFWACEDLGLRSITTRRKMDNGLMSTRKMKKKMQKKRELRIGKENFKMVVVQ